MSATTGKVIKVCNEIKSVTNDLVAVDTSDGIKFDCKNFPNERLMFLVKNTEASTAKDVIVVKPQNGGYAAADEDLKISLAAGTEAVIWVESAKYANVDGSIVLKGGSASVKAVAIMLG